MGLIVHLDGGARGNPGPAGAGVTISAEDGTLIHEGAYYLGQQTNNSAEYHALIRALQRAARCRPDAITVYSDSQLLVRQITGQYRVKSPSLARLFEQVQLLLLRLPCWNIRHIPREENSRADELANLAMDRRRDVIVFDADPQPDGERAHATGKPPNADDETHSATHTRESMEQEACTTGVPEVAVGHAARVALARAPEPAGCPAGACFSEPFTVQTTLPAGLCVHAAHALLPTILAILNTDVGEISAVPTMTVRCMHPACGATFHVSPARGSNGAASR